MREIESIRMRMFVKFTHFHTHSANKYSSSHKNMSQKREKNLRLPRPIIFFFFWNHNDFFEGVKITILSLLAIIFDGWRSIGRYTLRNVLLSPISRLWSTRTPCIHDSSTCAPCAPNELLLKSKCKPAVDSLHANPSSKCFNASSGNLHVAIFKCFRLSELVKNCLNDGGISLPFFVLKKLCDTFKCVKWVEHPRNRAPNSWRWFANWEREREESEKVYN